MEHPGSSFLSRSAVPNRWGDVGLDPQNKSQTDPESLVNGLVCCALHELARMHCLIPKKPFFQGLLESSNSTSVLKLYVAGTAVNHKNIDDISLVAHKVIAAFLKGLRCFYLPGLPMTLVWDLPGTLVPYKSKLNWIFFHNVMYFWVSQCVWVGGWGLGFIYLSLIGSWEVLIVFAKWVIFSLWP